MNNNEMIRKINKSEKDIVKVNEQLDTIKTRVNNLENIGSNVDTSTIQSLVEIIPSNNLFDYTKIIKNYTFTNSSAQSVTGNFFKLPIGNGEKYATNLGWKAVHYFNSENKHIKTQMYAFDDFVIIPINEGENYCLVTLDSKEYINNNEVHIIEGTNIEHYTDKYAVIKTSKSRWNNKKWLVIGDSITFERKGLDGDLANKTYAGMVARKLGFKYYINEAIAGKTLDYYNTNLDKFISDYDLVTIMLGTNDHGYNTPVGTVDDADNTTISGRVDIMINALRSKNPNAVIAFLTPIKRVGTGDSTNLNDETGYLNKVGVTTKEVAEAIKSKCKLYSIPCLDLYDAIEPLDITLRKKYFINSHLDDGDGTHPNQDGHAKYIAPKVESFLESIAPYDNYYESIVDSNTYGEIILNKTSITIIEGQSDNFTVKLDKSPTNNQIVSLSLNNSDVTVSPNILIFTPSNYSTTQTVTISVAEDNDDYSNESCIVTLTSPNVTNKTINVTITDNDQPPSENIPVQSVALNKHTHTMKVDETLQLTPVITPSDATNKNVTWETSNNNCEVIGGLVTGKTQGECVITCKTVDGNKTDTCTFTIEAKDIAEPNDVKSLIFDFTGKTADTTSILSSGTLSKELTVEAGTFNTYGLAQGKTIAFHDIDLMNNFNNSDFLFICKWQCDNAGVSPTFINSSERYDGYVEFIKNKTRNKFKLYTHYPSFYQERFAYVGTYERPEDADINNTYTVTDTSADKKQIPYDTNIHTIAYAYSNSNKTWKIYVDEVYKDFISTPDYTPNWSGLLVGFNATTFYKILLQNNIPNDSEIIQLMSNL